MMKCMHHMNVIKFYGVITPTQSSSKQLKVLIEYVNQGSLLRLLRKGKVMLRGKYKICLESAQGLAYLHLHGIIHRDIAARNILIQMTAEGVMTVKVSDFGLSRSDETGRGYELKTARRLPLKWMAPECFEKKLWTKSSDVWSFGIMAWEVFENGLEPFSDPQSPHAPAALSKYICSGNINPRPYEVSDSMWNLMKMCWTIEYSQRINILEVEQRLRAIIEEQMTRVALTGVAQTPEASSMSTTSRSSSTVSSDNQSQITGAAPTPLTTIINQTPTVPPTKGRKSASMSAAPANSQTTPSVGKIQASTSD
uniref:Protein kinase domain-containing protein n=1 Tax=Romanomermis culicivorax TaxID=13658 RepID=A0A915L998_ROMCU